MLEAYARHFNCGNFEQWLSLWNKNGVQMMPYVPARVGIDEIRAVMKPVFKNYTVELRINEIQDVIAYHDSGLTRCKYSLTLIDRKGNRITGDPDGKTLTLYSRQPDGSWEIMYDCSNTNARARAKVEIDG